VVDVDNPSNPGRLSGTLIALADPVVTVEPMIPVVIITRFGPNLVRRTLLTPRLTARTLPKLFAEFNLVGVEANSRRK